jgi:hypothetical protein
MNWERNELRSLAIVSGFAVYLCMGLLIEKLSGDGITVAEAWWILVPLAATAVSLGFSMSFLYRFDEINHQQGAHNGEIG